MSADDLDDQLAALLAPKTPTRTATTLQPPQPRESPSTSEGFKASSQPPCSLCREPVAQTHAHFVRGSCAHVEHAECHRRLLAIGRTACRQCSAPDDTAHTLPPACDVDARAAALIALEYTRVRDDQRGGGEKFVELKAAAGGDGVELGVLARYLPRRTPFALRCADAQCVGPTLCLHVCGEAISLEAAEAYVFFTGRRPPIVPEVVPRVAALLHARASAASLVRAGVTCALLACLGVTVHDLTATLGYSLDVLIASTLVPSWRHLLLLGFDWRQLAADRRLLPPLIGAADVRYATLVATFGFDYADFADTLSIGALELLALDADARQLVATGATRLDFALLAADEKMTRRGGIEYFLRAFRLTPALFASAPAADSALFARASKRLQVAYATLVAKLGGGGGGR